MASQQERILRYLSRLLQGTLHTTPREMDRYWRMSAIGGVQSGSMGVQGHYANAIAAFYIACGQDPACVAESAVGVTRFEVTEAGELYGRSMRRGWHWLESCRLRLRFAQANSRRLMSASRGGM
jgi:Hydroxymethylglutaryl-coenzyme A reductase